MKTFLTLMAVVMAVVFLRMVFDVVSLDRPQPEEPKSEMLLTADYGDDSGDEHWMPVASDTGTFHLITGDTIELVSE